VRNAFRPNTAVARKETRRKSKSLSTRIKDSMSRVYGSTSSISEVDGLDSFLTMPELKRKRQTSVALLRKTRKKNPTRNVGMMVWNPAFTMEDDVKNNMTGKEIKDDKTAFFHRKLARKKSHEVEHKVSLKRSIGLKTETTSLREAPLAEIHANISQDIERPNEKYDVRRIEEIVTLKEGYLSNVDLEIRAEPSLNPDDSMDNLTDEIHQQERPKREQHTPTKQVI
jgi:hypothetical protein